MTSAITIYTGTCTMTVTDNTATITKVTDDTAGGFATLVAGARFECTVGGGTVDSNTGTVITISCWSGSSTTDTISWKGIPVLSNAASVSAAVDILRSMNTLNSLPTGRVMTAAASTTIERMDALIGGRRFISMALTAPPDSPSDGDTYLVADDAEDAWADEVGNIAHRQDGDWMYISPVAGMIFYNAADGLYYRYTGSAWTADLAVLGVAQTFTANQTVTGITPSLYLNGTTSGAVRFQQSDANKFVFGYGVAGISGVALYNNTLSALQVEFLDTGDTEFVNGDVSITSAGSASTLNLSSEGGSSTDTNTFLTLTNGAGNSCLLGMGRTGLSGFLGNAMTLRNSYTTNGYIIFEPAGASTATYVMSSAAFFSGTTNAKTLGSASYLWSQVYAATSTISTSDSTKKTNVRAVASAEIVAAQTMWNNICILQYIAAVNSKGADVARLHVGAIADTQVSFDAVSSVQKILEDNGLDPTRYGFWCRDAKTEEVTATKTVTQTKTYTVTETITGTKSKQVAVADDDGNYTVKTVTEDVSKTVEHVYPVVDADGNEVTEDVEVSYTTTQTVTDADGNAEYNYSLRYTELIMFILRGIAQAHSDLKARVAALESAADTSTSTTSSTDSTTSSTTSTSTVTASSAALNTEVKSVRETPTRAVMQALADQLGGRKPSRKPARREPR